MKKLPNSHFMVVAEEILLNLAKVQQENKAASQSHYGFKARRGVFLTPQELAAALSVSTKTLERWRKYGGGPPYVKIATKHIRYPIAGLEEWVRAAIIAHSINGESE